MTGQPENTQPASKTPGGIQFFSLVVSLLVLGYLFVWTQRSIVEHPWLFVTLVTVLVFVAFLSSATEAAFTVASKRKDIEDALFTDKTNLANELQPLDQKIALHGSISLNRQDKKQWEGIMRRVNALNRKQRALDGTDRDEFVGSLSAFSVFLNTGLAAFLPVTLLTSLSSEQMTKVPFYWPVKLDVGFDIIRYEVTFSGNKLLIFFTSSLMVLILGKIVPKFVGFRYPKLFAYDSYRFARTVQCVLGWIAVGASWPLNRFLRQ